MKRLIVTIRVDIPETDVDRDSRVLVEELEELMKDSVVLESMGARLFSMALDHD